MALAGLAGKVVIVTGASRGIGRAVAERFAAEGAHLVLSSRRGGDPLHATVAACAAAGAEVVTVEGDVGDPAVAADLAARAQERFGRIDVLVGCAGVVLEEPLVTTSDEAARRAVETNVLGTIWAVRAVVPAMLRQRAGCIVSLSSSLARRPARGSAVYAGTRGFVEAFTAALAAEVGRKGVRAVAVAPGRVETEMAAALRRDAPEPTPRGNAAGRAAAPAEIAATIAFLASDDASHVNGAVLAVDGGEDAARG